MVQPRINPPPPPTTPSQAPWDDVAKLIARMDKMTSLLQQIIDKPMPQAITPTPTIIYPSTPTPIKTTQQPQAVVTSANPLTAEPEEQLYRENPRATGTFYSKMFDWKKGARVVMLIHSTLNENIQVQPIGNFREIAPDAVEISSSKACNANSDITIGFAWDDWHPFVGVRLSITTAPTSGELEVKAIKQI